MEHKSDAEIRFLASDAETVVERRQALAEMERRNKKREDDLKAAVAVATSSVRENATNAERTAGFAWCAPYLKMRCREQHLAGSNLIH